MTYLKEQLDIRTEVLREHRHVLAGLMGLETSAHSQRRTSRYIANTTETATADPNTATTKNGIAPNTPFVALRKPLSPCLRKGQYPRAAHFKPICSGVLGPRLIRFPVMWPSRTSYNSVKRKFAEISFHAFRWIRT